jgi:glycosyltransferase involved in cell wall biosynthesis
MSGAIHKAFVVDLLALSPFYDRYLIEALAARIDARLYATSFAYEPAYFASAGVRLASGVFDRVAPLGIRDKRVRRALSLAEYAVNFGKLIADVRRERPEVVHVQWLPLLERSPIELHALARIRKLGAALVYTAHNALPHDSGEKHKARYAQAYAAMDRILVHTEHERARLTRELGVNPARIDLAVHGPMFHDLPPSDRGRARGALGLDASDDVVLCAGILRPYKGTEDLLDAMPRLLVRRPNALLLLAGQGEPRFLKALEDRVRALGIERRVKLLTRYVPVAELPLLYAAADVSVLPYRAASQSGALFTAASFDAPLVATEVGGLAEVLRGSDRAVLVPPSHPTALADGLASLLSLPLAERRAMAERLRAWASGEQSWAHAADRAIESYARAYATRER